MSASEGGVIYVPGDRWWDDIPNIYYDPATGTFRQIPDASDWGEFSEGQDHIDTTEPEEDSEGCNTPKCDDPEREELKAELTEVRDTIASMLGTSDFEIVGEIVVSGARIPFSVDSQNLSALLSAYDYFLNSTATDQYGVGASFSDYAVLDPQKIEDSTPIITVQGESPTPEQYAKWNWYILHEFVHSLLAAVDTALFNQWWTDHGALGEGIYEDSDEFQQNEELTDALVDKIAEALGILVSTNLDSRIDQNPFQIIPGNALGLPGTSAPDPAEPTRDLPLSPGGVDSEHY